MKRVLLTGGTGFVGANLVRRLLADGHDVNLLVRRGHNPWRIRDVMNDLRIHESALTDIGSVVSVVESVRPDWVFHLSAYGAYPDQQDVSEMVRTNIMGAANLMQACLSVGFEAFVNTGSSSEYGFKDHAPAEDESLDPNSHYAVTKASATLLCRYEGRKNGVHMPTLRLYSVYGPYEEPTRLMPTLVVRGLQRTLPALASPNTARDFVYVDDVVDAYIRAAAAHEIDSGAIYNVGTGKQTTLSDLVEIASRYFGIPDEPLWESMSRRSWDTDVWVSDSTKIQADLGWKPRYAIQEGFERLVAWFEEHPDALAFYREKIG